MPTTYSIGNEKSVADFLSSLAPAEAQKITYENYVLEVADDADSATQLSALRIASKQECSRRIRVAFKDQPTQINLTSLAVALVNKRALSGLTPDEEAILVTADLARKWVTDMLMTSRNFLAGGDPLSDTAWPATPLSVVALINEI
jgi:hypothetical protein